jgi:hypothetical protein
MPTKQERVEYIKMKLLTQLEVRLQEDTLSVDELLAVALCLGNIE